jgi:predicted alpha/beta hydrolase
MARTLNALGDSAAHRGGFTDHPTPGPGRGTKLLGNSIGGEAIGVADDHTEAAGWRAGRIDDAVAIRRRRHLRQNYSRPTACCTSLLVGHFTTQLAGDCTARLIEVGYSTAPNSACLERSRATVLTGPI